VSSGVVRSDLVGLYKLVRQDTVGARLVRSRSKVLFAGISLKYTFLMRVAYNITARRGCVDAELNPEVYHN
jgi:hypothetical protein